jgi:chlorophyll/bacteriochlorophyll a synthase
VTSPSVARVRPDCQGNLTVTMVTPDGHLPAVPAAKALLQLLKPITWFPPMWAFACGVVASGAHAGAWRRDVLGVLLAGPLVCGASQVVNDWFDRDVDAINEPDRPIPSGRVPGRWGLWFAIGWSGLAAAMAIPLGHWGFGAVVLALVLAWAYSAPPLRLKRNGWWGNAAVGFSYEGLAWITGASLLVANPRPAPASLALALLYSVGAHGIMTLNDFKAIEGDRRMGIGSLPVRLGVDRAAQVACAAMGGVQIAVIALLIAWQHPRAATAVTVLLLVQGVMMRRFLRAPRAHALWYSAAAVPFYVTGMMVSAAALRSVG